MISLSITGCIYQVLMTNLRLWKTPMKFKSQGHISQVYTLKVLNQEEGETSARYLLNDPDDMVDLLRDLAKRTTDQG